MLVQRVQVEVQWALNGLQRDRLRGGRGQAPKHADICVQDPSIYANRKQG